MTKKNWLLIAIGAAVVTAGGIFLALRNKNSGEVKPPKKAPQVPISNPGEQSEFTTAASESELG
ncbi:MAG: hypothetical protein ACJ75F_12780 [Flavisolibacter sp.]|jgi:hypothetical protein